MKKKGCGGHGYTEADDWPRSLLKEAAEKREKEIYSCLAETWVGSIAGPGPEFACRALRLPPTVRKHACEAN